MPQKSKHLDDIICAEPAEFPSCRPANGPHSHVISVSPVIVVASTWSQQGAALHTMNQRTQPFHFVPVPISSNPLYRLSSPASSVFPQALSKPITRKIYLSSSSAVTAPLDTTTSLHHHTSPPSPSLHPHLPRCSTDNHRQCPKTQASSPSSSSHPDPAVLHAPNPRPPLQPRTASPSPSGSKQAAPAPLPSGPSSYPSPAEERREPVSTGRHRLLGVGRGRLRIKLWRMRGVGEGVVVC